MKDYVIFTESTSDLPASMIDDLEIRVIPMEFGFDGESYLNYPDHRDLGVHEFYERLRNGENSKTSLVNTMRFIENFEPIVKDGVDILYIGFSSGLSGTYGASLIAADQLKEKYLNCKILCIDTKAASMGEGLIVYTAAKKKEEGMDIDSLYHWIEENSKNMTQWFTVDDLNHLKRGGRVSALSASIGTMLHVKPVLHVDDDGCLIPMKNVRGRKKSLIALFNQMVETCIDPEEQVIFIGHGDCLEDAEFLKKLILNELRVKDVVINYIGPSIGSHSGPGTVALFFFGTSR
jgi:DegV family protein with EDD domain